MEKFSRSRKKKLKSLIPEGGERGHLRERCLKGAGTLGKISWNICRGGRIISGGDGEESRNADLKKDLVGVKTRESCFLWSIFFSS